MTQLSLFPDFIQEQDYNFSVSKEEAGQLALHFLEHIKNKYPKTYNDAAWDLDLSDDYLNAVIKTKLKRSHND